ncbi:MAG: hypothetical protein A2V84_08645 [Chloroflexi bacterium RBG_16_70_13]|nr:MAG: hypothetical protein A2V84_08645 [Chloroflexi bacterium RBG_16_70_13]
MLETFSGISTERASPAPVGWAVRGRTDARANLGDGRGTGPGDRARHGSWRRPEDRLVAHSGLRGQRRITPLYSSTTPPP